MPATEAEPVHQYPIHAVRQRRVAVTDVSGRGSYPLYIVHYPFLTLLAHSMWREHPGSYVVWAVAGAAKVGVSLLSWLVLKLIDKRGRHRLKVRTDAAARSYYAV